jgi:endogenous inhibitor of DNA gyrase (YacG/DUF329 family)
MNAGLTCPVCGAGYERLDVSTWGLGVKVSNVSPFICTRCITALLLDLGRWSLFDPGPDGWDQLAAVNWRLVKHVRSVCRRLRELRASAESN